uniref:Uncharacterized protein n=1 Tax=Anguilla anguilla TaxID=7936 RepID=A0A0E9PXV9_ANGAN
MNGNLRHLNWADSSPSDFKGPLLDCIGNRRGGGGD